MLCLLMQELQALQAVASVEDCNMQPVSVCSIICWCCPKACADVLAYCNNILRLDSQGAQTAYARVCLFSKLPSYRTVRFSKLEHS